MSRKASEVFAKEVAEMRYRKAREEGTVGTTLDFDALRKILV